MATAGGPREVARIAVSGTAMSPAERAARHAVIAATRIPARPAGRRGIVGSDHPALRRGTGLAVIAIGLITLLAVPARLGVVDARVAGGILATTGAAWVWLPVGAKRELLRSQVHRVVAFLEWHPGAATEVRCSLDELLPPQPAANAAQTGTAEGSS